MSDRLCFTCKHMSIDPGSPHYSEYTPGSPMEAGCNKNHYDLDGFGNDEQAWNEKIRRAATCADYAPSGWAEAAARAAADSEGV